MCKKGAEQPQKIWGVPHDGKHASSGEPETTYSQKVTEGHLAVVADPNPPQKRPRVL